MKIDSLIVEDSPVNYFSDEFRRVLEDHMSFLRSDSSTRIVSIEPMNAYRYEFDLFGLLRELGVSQYMHWIVMRLNNLTSPTDVTKSLTQLLIPNAGVIDKIRQSHFSSRRVS